MTPPLWRESSRSIGEVLTAVRQWRKLTQKQLSERTNLPQTSISLLERGFKEPTFDIIEKLSKELDVDPLLILSLGHHYQNLVEEAIEPEPRQFAVAFGKVLRLLRNGAQLSQGELAHRADLERTTPLLLERGIRGPTAYNLVRIARVLEVDPPLLLRMTLRRMEVDLGS